VNRILHAFLLVFALLFAQSGAVVHAAVHIAAASHGSDQGLPSDSACELCVGYAQLAGGAPLPALPGLPGCEAHEQRHEAVIQVFLARPIVHSRARAPPFFS
jgi:hypothetical protein